MSQIFSIFFLIFQARSSPSSKSSSSSAAVSVSTHHSRSSRNSGKRSSKQSCHGHGHRKSTSRIQPSSPAFSRCSNNSAAFPSPAKKQSKYKRSQSCASATRNASPTYHSRQRSKSYTEDNRPTQNHQSYRSSSNHRYEEANGAPPPPTLNYQHSRSLSPIYNRKFHYLFLFILTCLPYVFKNCNLRAVPLARGADLFY